MACEYHPAPLTQPLSTARPAFNAVNANGTGGWFGVLDLSMDQGIAATVNASCATSPVPSLSNRPSTVSSAWDARSSADRPLPVEGADRGDLDVRSGKGAPDHTYYGSTSSVSVFLEAGSPPTKSISHADGVVAATDVSAATSEMNDIELGGWIIGQLDYAGTICTLAEIYVRASQVSPVATLVPSESIRTLETSYTPLAFSKIEQRRAARAVTENTRQPVTIHSNVSARTFIGQFTGENLRWEFLGLIFAWAGRAAMSDVALPAGFTKATFAQRMMECSNSCIALHRQQATSSDVLAWCLYENLVLLTFQHGESSHAAWRRLGDLSAEIYALGLHRGSERPLEVPPFLVQARRKVFHASYTIDKVIATFFGRPPRISAHYCNNTLPFDIDDSAFLVGLPLTHAALDANVWNDDGRFRPATWVRVRSINSQLKEKVLELLLDPDTAAKSTKAEELLARSQDTWESIPSSLRYDGDCGISTLPTATGTILLMVFLEHLQNEFQLRRVLCQSQHDLTRRDSLLEVSMHILTTAMGLPGAATKSAELQKDQTWILLHFAVPSAGVLANELRLRTQRGEPTPPSTSRSQIIRQVSVLISILEAVSWPAEGNSDLCDSAAKTLSRILSDVLDNAVPTLANADYDWTPTSPLSMTMLTEPNLDLIPNWSDFNWTG
ncbi:MAG: hypothetical protein M4579_005753 [Chaenotheca gracillima]|nr:MAG: hypothetical protein M4579_005753 [Chaenotheca gracillima]